MANEETKIQDEHLVENISNELGNLADNLELLKIGHFFLATTVFFILHRVINFVFEKAKALLANIQESKISELKLKGLTLVKKENLNQVIDSLFNVVKVISYIVLFYTYTTYAFAIFPATRGIATKLVNYLLYLLGIFSKSALAFIPNFLTILFIIIVTYYILALTKFLVKALYQQKIVFAGFKREWIQPTYLISRFFIIAFAIVMIFPYLPGADSSAFKGVSVFIGVLFTLGSSSAIANIIAGIVLIYMSPFRVGDRVKVGDIVGSIVEMTLLVTRIRTIRNEETTIPNSLILAKEVVNYSSSCKSNNSLILSIPIGLGYDVDVKTVDSLLAESCKGVEYVLTEPSPFVLVKDLADSYINYELNIYTKDATQILQIKSNLQRNILDKFKQNSIEILSPAYLAVRDGNKSWGE